MSLYDNTSPIGFYDDDDIEAAVGDSQLHADDTDAMDALNGDYDDIMDDADDSLEEMMDADNDQEELNGLPEDETLVAQEIVAQCTGTLEDGTPKAAVSVSLDMVNPITFHKQSLATQAMYKPVVEFRSRLDFLEVLFTFPTASDANLRVFFNHLEKYGQKLDSIEEDDQMVPLMTVTIVPIAALGAAYIVAAQPAFWALSSPTFGAPMNQLKVSFRAADVNFWMTDETDLGGILSAVQREQEAEDEFYAQAEAREEERRAAENAGFAFDMSDFEED
jgi:hypothetical protein